MAEPSEEPQEAQLRLRAASDALLLLISEVDQLEREKRDTIPASPRFRELATAVRQAAQDLAGFAGEEEVWSRSKSVDRPEVGKIAEAENPRPLRDILARWREIDRQLAGAQPGSPETMKLFAEFERVRDEYLAAFRARNRNPGR